MSIFLKDNFERMLSDEMKYAIRQTILQSEKAKINIYLIGGIVRDLILNNRIKDIDIAVEGDAVCFAEKLVQHLNCEIISAQENLRTAKVKFPSGIEIDFASTREEQYLDSGMLPVACNFGCKLEKDVKRRDFTINTLALILTGDEKFKLIDYFDGYADISNKQIKILHDKSFIDDPSRIIRALKFKKRFDFEIEQNTFSLIDEYLNNINKNMPLERIKNELRQYFSIKKQNIYGEIIKTRAYKLISDNPVQDFNYSRLLEITDYELIDEKDVWFIYICLLLVNDNYHKEKLNMTAFEIKVLDEVNELLSEKNIKLNDNERIYKLYNNKIDLSIAIFYILTGEKSVIKFLTALKQIKVLITGKDLINLGFIPSKYFSELFDKILKEKLKGKLTKKEDEIKFVQKFLKKQSR